jgi:hypothetical protein
MREIGAGEIGSSKRRIFEMAVRHTHQNELRAFKIAVFDTEVGQVGMREPAAWAIMMPGADARHHCGIETATMRRCCNRYHRHKLRKHEHKHDRCFVSIRHSHAPQSSCLGGLPILQLFRTSLPSYQKNES